jgi:crotonobetainyl-CoA:carnitine CoA-transferase CaiB-like acyl-CoA transferase
MDGRRFGTRLDLPRVGEHTREVLASLGYGVDAVNALITRRVVLAV